MKKTKTLFSPFPPVKNPVPRISRLPRLIIPLCGLLLCGCQVLTYHAPTGECFTRSTLGTTTAIASLAVESTTNGVRKVELRGYQNDGTQALGTVTDAAVKAAIQSVK